MSSFTLSPDKGILPCPSCGEMVYSDAAVCRFCSAPIDRETAARGAELQKRVNDACNEAKWVRNAAGVMWFFLLLRMLFFPPAGWGYIGLFFTIPVWLIIWKARYSSLETADPDYKTAKRDWLVALIIWLPALGLSVVTFFF